MGTSSNHLEDDAVRFRLEIWHPDCWTLEVTQDRDAGLIAQGLYTVEGEVHARMTAHGETEAAVDQLVDAIETTPWTNAVTGLTSKFEFNRGVASGKATREILVEYPERNSIYGPILDQGFVPDERVRITGGQEYWTVLAEDDRDELAHRVDEIRSARDADIDILGISAAEPGPVNPPAEQSLSTRQREAIELACRRGYYSWPRETSPRELADELGINKATFLEHLRKAEAKLLESWAFDRRH